MPDTLKNILSLIYSISLGSIFFSIGRYVLFAHNALIVFEQATIICDTSLTMQITLVREKQIRRININTISVFCSEAVMVRGR